MKYKMQFAIIANGQQLSVLSTTIATPKKSQNYGNSVTRNERLEGRSNRTKEKQKTGDK